MDIMAVKTYFRHLCLLLYGVVGYERKKERQSIGYYYYVARNVTNALHVKNLLLYYRNIIESERKRKISFINKT